MELVYLSTELLAALSTLATWATEHPEIWEQYIQWADKLWTAHKPAPLTDADREKMLEQTLQAKDWADTLLRKLAPAAASDVQQDQ